MSELLRAEDVVKGFPLRWPQRGTVWALRGVSLRVGRGESLGVVGESGCGKSTLGKVLVGLLRPTSGGVWFRGQPVERLRGAERRALQMVFQDPQSSLNPRLRVEQILCEGLDIHGLPREAGLEMLERVGLERDLLTRYPHELSTGQRQRLGIARALCLRPELLVADEPVSALDVSVQAQILRLLEGLRRDLGVAYVVISHDLRVIQALCDRVAVMYGGQVVEEASREELFGRPLHPYTRALLYAAGLGSERMVLQGEPSALSERGCGLAERCPLAEQRCRREPPAPRSAGPGHLVRCHLV